LRPPSAASTKPVAPARRAGGRRRGDPRSTPADRRHRRLEKAVATSPRELAGEIRAGAIAWAIAAASVEEIDRLNILHATLLAMQRAVEALAVTPARAVIDGNRCRVWQCRPKRSSRRRQGRRHRRRVDPRQDGA